MHNSQIFKQLNFYKSYNLPIFIILFLSSLFTNSSLFLLLSSLKQLDKESNMTLIFIILFGLLFLISISMITIIISINFNVREKDLINRRLIGLAFHKVFKNLLLEQSIIMIPSYILGFFASIFLNKLLIASLINKSILASSFSINYSFINIFLVLLVSFITLSAIMFLSTKKYKRIENNYKIQKNKKKQFFKILIGSLFLTSYFLLIIFNNTEVLYLFGGIFFIIGLYFLLEIFIVCIAKVLFKFFIKYFTISSSIKNMEFNADLITKIILMLVNSMIFLNFSINVINKMGIESYELNQNAEYLNGLMFLGSYLNIVFISFTFIILINGFLMYLKSLQKETETLRKLGFTRSKIFLRNIFQFLIIWIFYVLLSFIGTTLISIIWKDQSALLNLKYWYIEIFVVLLIMLFLSLIEWTSKFLKRNELTS
ncbi:FtsX-like permease family protein [Mesoplasma chauliocola]|nr:FtsX-like permease family protein [Mesoplasma chauliocola]